MGSEKIDETKENLNLFEGLRLVIRDKGFIYWITTLILYGSLLSALHNYEKLSIVYHILLLGFPIAIVIIGGESIKSLGIRKGVVKEGFSWLGIITVVLLGESFLISYVIGGNIYLYSEAPIILTIILLVLAPVTEELMFRGYFQTKFTTKLGHKHGLVIASILFALIHTPKVLITPEVIFYRFIPSSLQNPVTSLAIFFVTGLVLGEIYKETKSIYYPIITHFIINFFAYFIRF